MTPQCYRTIPSGWDKRFLVGTSASPVILPNAALA